jgi:ribonuclease VapC
MITVDTSAIIAVLQDADDCDPLVDAMVNEDLQMCAGTLAELLIVATAGGKTSEINALITELGITIAPLDQAGAKAAHQAFEKYGKGRHRAALNLGDCFAYALAKRTGTALLYVGNDFAQTDLG